MGFLPGVALDSDKKIPDWREVKMEEEEGAGRGRERSSGHWDRSGRGGDTARGES